MNRVNALIGLALWCVILAGALALSGCGGGGGGTGGAVPSVSLVATSPPPVAPPAASEPAGAKPAGDCSMGYWGDSIAGLTTPLLDPRIAVGGHAVIGGTALAAQMTFLQAPLIEATLTIEYGTNDANGETPMEPALRAMLDRARSLGKHAVLTGMPHTTTGDALYHSSYDALIKSLANEYKADYADWPSVRYDGPSDLKADGVHPTGAYLQRLADALSAVILKSCSP